MMKSNITAGIFLLVAIMLISGAAMLAMAAPGTQDDPVITLDYLDNKFKPDIMIEVEAIGQKLIQDFDQKLENLEGRLQSNASNDTTSPNEADRFSVVTLSNGQILTCSVGTEIMLRVGAANGRGADPALVNYTSGQTLTAGTALTQNNMYLVTIENNGITATNNLVRVLVRGEYLIS